MTKIQIKKMAVSFALLSFAILVFGSVLTGSRMTTALIRGAEAAFIFGALAWSFGSVVMNKEKAPEGAVEDVEASKGTQFDETV
jgi:hypothetical protein